MKNFGDHFYQEVGHTDWSIVYHQCGVINLWYKVYKVSIKAFRDGVLCKEGLDGITHIRANNVPCFDKEETIISIRTRGAMLIHRKDYFLFHRKRGVGEFGIVFSGEETRDNINEFLVVDDRFVGKFIKVVLLKEAMDLRLTL